MTGLIRFFEDLEFDEDAEEDDAEDFAPVDRASDADEGGRMKGGCEASAPSNMSPTVKERANKALLVLSSAESDDEAALEKPKASPPTTIAPSSPSLSSLGLSPLLAAGLAASL